MWLYPIPVVLSIAVWIFLFVSTGRFALYGTLIAMAGVAVYFAKEAAIRRKGL
jgi:hypothetical protein